jgi:hypothetical protein
MRVCENNSLNKVSSTAWLLALCALLFANTTYADGVFVRNAETQRIDNIYRLNAIIDYRLSPETLKALHNGVTLSFLVELEVLKKQRYWLDDSVATLKQRYQLTFHELSQTYQLSNQNSGSNFNFNTLGGATAKLGTLNNIPLLNTDLLTSEQNHYARMRASLEVSQLPTPLHLISYIMPGWSLSSEWYTWPLVD